MSKGKKAYSPGGIFSLILWGTALSVLVGVGYLAFSKAPKDENASKEQAEPWYKKQSGPPQMIRLPDAPLILAPEYAEIDPEIVEITPSQPLRTPPQKEEDTKPTPRLNDVDLSAKPETPPVSVAIYEEALPDDILAPRPLPAKPAENIGDPSTQDQLARADILTSMTPRWMRYAVDVSKTKEKQAQIALVIDDLGLDRKRTRQTLELPGPLTAAFLPYAKDLGEQTQKARKQGHELMLHMPMEPLNSRINAGPNHLHTRLGEDDLRTRIHWNLERFDQYVGVNNHMGSLATTDEKLMKILLEELQKREMVFLDSRTNPKSVARKHASLLGLPYAERNVFLDNINEKEAVLKQLQRLERLAKKSGYAVGIGHPRDGTIQALQEWIPKLADKGIRLVPISQIVRLNLGI